MKKFLAAVISLCLTLAAFILLPHTRVSAVNWGGDKDEESVISSNALVIDENNGLWNLKKEPPEKILDNVKRFCEADEDFVISYDGELWNVKNEPEKILENVKTLYKAYNNYYAICTDGTLWGWGDNKYYYLGAGNDEPQEKPTAITDNAREVIFINYAAFLIKTDGSLWSWGRKSPLLGFFALENQLSPVKILDNVKEVDGARSAVYALCEDGTLWGWGCDNDTSEGRRIYSHVLGIGPGSGDGSYNNPQYTPTKIMDDVKSFDTVGLRTMAIKNDGTLWGWGADHGQMPNYKNEEYVPVKLLESAKEIHMESDYSYVVHGNGELWIYGSHAENRDASYTYSDTEERKLCNATMSVAQLFSSDGDRYELHLILDKNGELWECGPQNNERKIADNVAKLYNASAGSDIYFLKEDGALWRICSDYTDGKYAYSQPEKILDEVEKVRVLGYDGRTHRAAAVTKGGELWIWGAWADVYGADGETIYTPEKVFDDVRTADKVIVFVNGARVDTDSTAYIKDGRTFVPMRAIFEAMGASVTWDNDERCAIGEKDGATVKIKIGENAIYKNGERTELDCATEIVDERTMVPVRAIAEAFGAKVDWDNETRCVIITE